MLNFHEGSLQSPCVQGKTCQNGPKQMAGRLLMVDRYPVINGYEKEPHLIEEVSAPVSSRAFTKFVPFGSTTCAGIVPAYTANATATIQRETLNA